MTGAVSNFRNEVRAFRARWAVVRPYALPHSRSILGAGGCLISGTALGTLSAILTGKTIDALYARSLGFVVALVTVQMFASLLQSLVGYLQNRFTIGFSQGLGRDLRVALASKIQHANIESFNAQTLGAITNRVDGDVWSLTLSVEAAVPALVSIISVAWLVVVLPFLNWKLSLLAYVFMPLWFVLAGKSGSALAPVSRKLSVIRDAFDNIITETLRLPGVLRVKNFIQYESDGRRLYEVLSDLRAAAFEQNSVRLPYSLAQGALLTVSSGAIFLFGSWLVIQKQCTIGTLVALVALLARLYGPLASVSGFQAQLVSMAMVIDRVIEMLGIPQERTNGNQVRQFAISMRNVSFAFGKNEVLRNVNLHVGIGDRVVIQGESGSGKTTLAYLLLCLYRPTSGVIYLGEESIEKLDINDVRRSIIYVGQQPGLHRGTVRENLLYGNPEAAEEYVDEIIEMCQLTHVINELPLGLDTILDQDGSRLSTGQRQRLMIARALLVGPRILILDEATNGLDREMESKLLDVLHFRFPTMTIVHICHRPPQSIFYARVINLDELQVGMNRPGAPVVGLSDA